MCSQPRYATTAPIEYATKLLDEAGLEHGKSKSVAEVLIEADLLGPWLTVMAIDLAIERVRLPGEGGLRKRERHRKVRASMHLTIIGALAPWSRKFGAKASPPRA